MACEEIFSKKQISVTHGISISQHEVHIAIWLVTFPGIGIHGDFGRRVPSPKTIRDEEVSFEIILEFVQGVLYYQFCISKMTAGDLRREKI